MLYCASIDTFGLANLMLVMVCLYGVRRQRMYLWPGYPNVGHAIAVSCELCCGRLGTFGLVNLILFIVCLYAVWCDSTYLCPGSLGLLNVSVRCMARA